MTNFMNFWKNKTKKIIFFTVILVLAVSAVFYFSQKPPLQGDWQEQLAVVSTAQFNGDFVTVKNVRNFRYYPAEADMHPGYYDKTYNLNEIKKVWYVTEPFNENKLAAHTFLSFEFNNGDFLAISIEARKTKQQKYSTFKGIFHTYPLVYIAADERDVLFLRANIRKDNVYVYPVKLERQENARILLVDMLNKMNKLVSDEPAWYNTFFANCTSSIAQHVNKISNNHIATLSWQLWLTASADELALKHGFLDTDLSIDAARKKFQVNEKSEKIGDVPEYSTEIRNFEE